MTDHRPDADNDSTPPARDTGVSNHTPDSAAKPSAPAQGAPALPDTLFDRLDHWVERYIKDHPEARPGL